MPTVELVYWPPHPHHPHPPANLIWKFSNTQKRWEHNIVNTCIPLQGLPRWLSGKESACHAGDVGSIPGSGGSPGEGNGIPVQYSCLGNPMDSGARRGLQSLGLQRVGHDWATKPSPPPHSSPLPAWLTCTSQSRFCLCQHFPCSALSRLSSQFGLQFVIIDTKRILGAKEPIVSFGSDPFYFSESFWAWTTQGPADSKDLDSSHITWKRTVYARLPIMLAHSDLWTLGSANREM